MSPLRAAREDDLPALATLWHDAWHESHAAHVPAALLRERTLESFSQRLPSMLPYLRVGQGSDGSVLGFCAIRTSGHGEIYQLFVAREARGTGLAEQLLRDGEARLLAAGCSRPKLDCLPQNGHAARFYERQGWQSLGIKPVLVDTPTGTFPLDCIVFERNLDSQT